MIGHTTLVVVRFLDLLSKLHHLDIVYLNTVLTYQVSYSHALYLEDWVLKCMNLSYIFLRRFCDIIIILVTFLDCINYDVVLLSI